MSSIKCSQCGLVNWSTQDVCKRCGSPIGQAGAVMQFAPAQPSYTSVPSSVNYSEARTYDQSQSGYSSHPYPQGDSRKSGLAIASMVLGILGFVTAFLLIGLLMAPIGFIIGIIALVKAKRRPFEYGGKGFAIAGVSICSAILFLYVPIVAAIAIPNLLASRRAANEGSAISSLRKLSAAQSSYAAVNGSYVCADLPTLGAKKYIDPVLSSGEKSGYRFTVANQPEGGCEIFATPISTSTGTRSFCMTTDGVIRAGKLSGKPASRLDEPID